jgi:hypothetical protein
MNWLNLQTNIIRRPEYVGCDPIQRATWLNLMIYCAEQENGGVIPECASWKDRRWQQTCGVTKAEIDDDCELWKFDGESLVIFGYPKEKEEEVQRNRESGQRGGKARSEAKVEAAKANGSKGGRPKTQAETQAETQAKPKRNPSENPTERKGKEEERNGTLPPTPQGDVSESADDFYEENMPTENAQSMLDLEKRVRSLRSGWELPLAYTEQKLLAAASRCLSELTAAQWQTIKDYMHAKIPQGVPAWQPRSRTKFLENPSDVWTHASAWRKKQEASRPPSNTIPMPVTSRPIISREELAEVFGDPIKNRKV